MISALAFENMLATMPAAPSDINVLILDDNQFDRVRIRRMFESLEFGFHLSEVENLDGLDQNLDNKDFDIVLIDYNLPQGDGLEALERIQKHERNCNATTVMIAGDDQSQIAVRALKSGCQDYIAKGTLSTHRLRSLVLSVIDAAQASPANTDDLHERLELLVSRVKEHHSSALQPKVAKIIQDIRSLRARVYQPHSPLAVELAAVEKRCLNLWSSLSETDAITLQAPKDVRVS